MRIQSSSKIPESIVQREIQSAKQPLAFDPKDFLLNLHGDKKKKSSLLDSFFSFFSRIWKAIRRLFCCAVKEEQKTIIESAIKNPDKVFTELKNNPRSTMSKVIDCFLTAPEQSLKAIGKSLGKIKTLFIKIEDHIPDPDVKFKTFFFRKSEPFRKAWEVLVGNEQEKGLDVPTKQWLMSFRELDKNHGNIFADLLINISKEISRNLENVKFAPTASPLDKERIPNLLKFLKNDFPEKCNNINPNNLKHLFYFYNSLIKSDKNKTMLSKTFTDILTENDVLPQNIKTPMKILLFGDLSNLRLQGFTFDRDRIFIRAMSQSDSLKKILPFLEDLQKLIGDKHPFATLVIQKATQIMKNKEAFEEFRRKIPISVTMYKNLHTSYHSN